MDTTDIIIPVWNNARITIECLQGLREHTGEHVGVPIRVILVDNGSHASERVAVERELAHHENHVLLRQPKNLGFAPAVNIGMDVVETPYFCVLNNDVVVTKGWLYRLREAMDNYLEYAALGPVTDHSGSTQQYNRIAERMDWPPLEFDEMAEHVNGQTEQTYALAGNLSYFCTLFRKCVTDDVGRLYEGFVNGGEDDDYNDRLREAGWAVGICLNCFVYHKHRATRNLIPDYRKYQRQNSALLRRRRAERNG